VSVTKLKLRQLADCIDSQTEPEPFSGVVYLTKGDKVLFESAHGFAIKLEFIPNKVNTRFQMASGCKIFTSVAICQLVEKGKLGFDTLLSKCVDVEFPKYAPDIAIHHLLTHSSGITSYSQEDAEPDYEALWQRLSMYKVREPRDFLTLFQHEPMRFSPGTRFEYNDGGYILLGLVIESVTGMSFPAYIRENVLEPAGMDDSGYYRTDQLPERTAYAYIRKADGTWRTNFFAVPIIGAPDGGAYTTAPDMHLFWKSLVGKKLLNTELTGFMREARIATSMKSPHTHYGYGIWIDQPDGTVRKRFVEGYDPGVAMRSAVYAHEGIILTVIGNTADALWPLFRRIEKVLDL